MNKLINSTKTSIVGVLTAFLGAFAGCDNTSKNWRRFLIPFALAGLAYGYLHSFWVITIMTMMIAFSTGYGIPDLGDNGSALARFWGNIAIKINVYFSNSISVSKVKLFINIMTRGTIAFMVNLSLLSIPILKGNWLIYWIGCLFIKLAYTTYSYRDLGGIYIKGKYLLISDIIVYGIIGLMTSIMIYF